MPTKASFDRMQAIGTLLVGIAAIAALVFTGLSTHATNGQLEAMEQGQITDRYNNAISNLGDPSVDIRLGGIYALQRIMQDSPRDQPTIVAVLCAFVRDYPQESTATSPHSSASPQAAPAHITPPTDVQAALTVVGTRNTANDGSTTVIDFTGADLTDASLRGADLADAIFSRANLSHVSFDEVNLAGAVVTDAKLINAAFSGVKFTDADFFGTDLTYAVLGNADFTRAHLTGANLTHADLGGANLTDAWLGANLTDADLTGADLTGANLCGAILRGVKGIHGGIPRCTAGSTPAR